MNPDLDIIQGLKPFEAKLFAELKLPEEVDAQLDLANVHTRNKGLTRANVERCVWRMICDRRKFGYLSNSSSGTRAKAVCFTFRANDRVFVSCGRGDGANPSPGSIWPTLQPFGVGNPETLERKFLAWAEGKPDDERPYRSTGPPAIEVTDCVRLVCSDDERTYLDLIKTADNRDEALLIFADWLEERGDERAEKIRSFTPGAH